MTGISQTVNEAAGFQIPFSDNETILPSPHSKAPASRVAQIHYVRSSRDGVITASLIPVKVLTKCNFRYSIGVANTKRYG